MTPPRDRNFAVILGLCLFAAAIGTMLVLGFLDQQRGRGGYPHIIFAPLFAVLCFYGAFGWLSCEAAEAELDKLRAELEKARNDLKNLRQGELK